MARPQGWAMFDFRMYIYGTTAMLKEIYIENYKSLRNVTVQFKDGLNIIIGKNGSGKSNLLELIYKFGGLRNRQALNTPQFSFNFHFKQDYVFNGYDYHIELYKRLNLNDPVKPKILDNDGDRIWVTRDKPFRDFFDRSVDNTNLGEIVRDYPELAEMVSFPIELLGYGAPSNVNWLDKPGKIDIGFQPVPNTSSLKGDLLAEASSSELINKIIAEYSLSLRNWPSDVRATISEVRSAFYNAFDRIKEQLDIVRFLTDFSPIQDIKLGEYTNVFTLSGKASIENLSLNFLVDGEWLPWSYLSDGTKRLFYLISEVCCVTKGLVLIDEPELGIHPHQLYKLMQFLDEQSATKQIIISTHSPIVLDALQSNELDRIIIAKMENGASKFERLTDEQIKDAKEYVENVNELSYYWLHHSELEGHD